MNNKKCWVDASFHETTEWLSWDFKPTKENSKPVKIGGESKHAKL